MFTRLKALIIKEFLAIWRDKKSRVILIGPPLLQLVIFSFAATLEVKNSPIAILNEDSGKPSAELIQRIEGSPYFKKVYRINKTQEVKQYIDSQKAVMVVNIKDDFSSKVMSGKPVDLQLLLDGRKTNVSQILVGYVGGVIEQYITDQKANLQIGSSILVPRNWFNANLDYIWFTVPCIAVILIMLLGLIITALSVAREREFGTFDQLLVSPLEPVEILIGKTVPAFIIGLLEGTMIITIGVLLFKIPFNGSILYLYFSMSIFLLAVIGVGLCISAISKTQQQAILGAFVFMVPFILLSGYATPVENMPQWLQDFTVVNIVKHFMIIIKGIMLKDIPFEVVVTHTIPIAIVAIITLSISVQMFKRRLG